MENAIKTIDAQDLPEFPFPQVSDITPMAMLNTALQSGADTSVLENLMALQERWEANQGRKAFDAAMASAKAEIGPIGKNREVDFTGKTGVRTNYRFEDLAQIAEAVNPILATHGLSYRYNTVQENGGITVTCIVSHRDGYSERNSLSAQADNSGNKNNIQAVGSAITYLQRYTLKAALGLAVSNDDDGKAIEKPDPVISEEQKTQITGLMAEVDADVSGLLKYFRIKTIELMPASRFNTAITMLNQKKAKANA